MTHLFSAGILLSIFFYVFHFILFFYQSQWLSTARIMNENVIRCCFCCCCFGYMAEASAIVVIVIDVIISKQMNEQATERTFDASA